MSDLVIEKDVEIVRVEHSNEAARMLASAQSFVIDCAEMAEAAAEDLGIVKAKLKVLEEKRTELKKPVLEAGKRIDAMFKELSEGYLKAEAVLKNALVGWQESERKRLEAERRIQEEAARKLREQQEAEARRQAEEARKAEEAARTAAAAGDAAAAAEAQAKAAEAAQAAAVAQETAQAIEHMAPAVVAAPAKLAGVSMREDWDFEIVDVNQIPREFLVVDEAKLRKVVKALKGDAKIAGVRVFSKPVVAAKAAK